MEFSIPISVVMPTYNTETTMLQQAVESILSQTFREFEFLIIDDGSTNDSVDYLNSLHDERIRLIRNPVNIGITKSLNIGLKEAKGKYIARMDADDISLPTRFEKQYAYMEAHPDVILCGTRATFFKDDPSRPTGISRTVPPDMEDYRVYLLFRNPGPIHSTAFFRHESMLEHDVLYDEGLVYAQDYGMWETISQLGLVRVLPDVLLRYRIHNNQITHSHRDRQMQCCKEVQRRLLTPLLGSVSTEELDLHYYYSSGFFPSAIICPQIEEWYARLLKTNKEKKLFCQRKLKQRIQKAKIKLVYQTIQVKDLSISKRVILFLRYIPLSRLPEALVKFHIWKNGG